MEHDQTAGKFAPPVYAAKDRKAALGREQPPHPSEEALANHVYQRVLEDIVTRRVAPGQRLRERELSEQHNVSRIPVREALHRLEQDGFILTAPRRGAVVRRLTLADVDELFDMRVILESFAARRAAERVANGADGGRLNEILGIIQDAREAGENQRASDLTAEFHAAIVDLADHRLLAGSLRPLQGLTRWIFSLGVSRPMELNSVEHDEIRKAILAGRPRLAESLAAAHVELGRPSTLRGHADWWEEQSAPEGGRSEEGSADPLTEP